MQIITTIAEAKEVCRAWQLEGLTIGLVPTMGYLHQGHASLMQAARAENDRLVATIFVNPTQFGPNEDFERYPRDLEADAALAKAIGVDMLFCPEVTEMYPPGYISYLEPAGLTDCLCGASRPGHFRGVCTVVLKLFNIIRPDKAYFGQKDAQQFAVLNRMVADMDLDLKMRRMPIVREADGLAMSSRNVYLSATERQEALALNRALQAVEQLFKAGERQTKVLIAAMQAELGQTLVGSLDYLEIVDLETLEPIAQIESSALCALAVFFGKTRLIDNVVLEI